MTITIPPRPVNPSPVGRAAPCRSEPDQWTEAGDDQTLRDLCRFHCHRRAACAREALITPDAAGIWAGIYLPPDDDDSPRHDRTRAQDYARHRLRVIATRLRDRSPTDLPDDPADDPRRDDDEPATQPTTRPNGPFRDTYLELRGIGLADWQIAKRLGLTNLSLLRQLHRYHLAARPEFVTMCVQEKRAGDEHRRQLVRA